MVVVDGDWHPAPVDVHLPPSGRDLSVGTRVCLLLAGLLVIAAGYLLVSPLERASAQGPPFDCGTALAPAGGDFARSICADLNQRRQLQAGAVLLGALLLGAGGWVAFGPVRRRRRHDDGPEDRRGDHRHGDDRYDEGEFGGRQGPGWVRRPGRTGQPPAALPTAQPAAEHDRPGETSTRYPDRP